jgi:hypothetical protein
MALFPEYDEIAYVPGIEITPRFSTSISALSGGQEKRRAKFTFPLYDLKISYELLTLADARTIWQFYKDRQGAFGTFYFYLPYLETFEGEYCGTGDGTEDLFDIPGKNVVSGSYIVYVGGVQKVDTVDYNITTGTGAEGADRIEFTGGNEPVSGDHVTIDFRGYYRFKVRFEEDNLTFEVFAQALTKMGITLVGVR